MSQFHYGSIKTNNNKIFIIRLNDLNSTMVRLKHKNYKYNPYLIYNSLNSTMVRLKPDLKYDNNAIYQKASQFHYGSIKTRHINKKFVKEYFQSQFHYGSIKTAISVKNKKIFIISLNSTMVRLKPIEFLWN